MAAILGRGYSVEQPLQSPQVNILILPHWEKGQFSKGHAGGKILLAMILKGLLNNSLHEARNRHMSD